MSEIKCGSVCVCGVGVHYMLIDTTLTFNKIFKATMTKTVILEAGDGLYNFVPAAVTSELGLFFAWLFGFARSASDLGLNFAWLRGCARDRARKGASARKGDRHTASL